MKKRKKQEEKRGDAQGEGGGGSGEKDVWRKEEAEGGGSETNGREKGKGKDEHGHFQDYTTSSGLVVNVGKGEGDCKGEGQEKGKGGGREKMLRPLYAIETFSRVETMVYIIIYWVVFVFLFVLSIAALLGSAQSSTSSVPLCTSLPAGSGSTVQYNCLDVQQAESFSKSAGSDYNSSTYTTILWRYAFDWTSAENIFAMDVQFNFDADNQTTGNSGVEDGIMPSLTTIYNGEYKPDKESGDVNERYYYKINRTYPLNFEVTTGGERESNVISLITTDDSVCSTNCTVYSVEVRKFTIVANFSMIPLAEIEGKSLGGSVARVIEDGRSSPSEMTMQMTFWSYNPSVYYTVISILYVISVLVWIIFLYCLYRLYPSFRDKTVSLHAIYAFVLGGGGALLSSPLSQFVHHWFGQAQRTLYLISLIFSCFGAVVMFFSILCLVDILPYRPTVKRSPKGFYRFKIIHSVVMAAAVGTFNLYGYYESPEYRRSDIFDYNLETDDLVYVITKAILGIYLVGCFIWLIIKFVRTQKSLRNKPFLLNRFRHLSAAAVTYLIILCIGFVLFDVLLTFFLHNFDVCSDVSYEFKVRVDSVVKSYCGLTAVLITCVFLPARTDSEVIESMCGASRGMFIEDARWMITFASEAYRLGQKTKDSSPEDCVDTEELLEMNRRKKMESGDQAIEDRRSSEPSSKEDNCDQSMARGSAGSTDSFEKSKRIQPEIYGYSVIQEVNDPLTDSNAFVCKKNNRIAIAFRGTKSYKNVATDLKTDKVMLSEEWVYKNDLIDSQSKGATFMDYFRSKLSYKEKCAAHQGFWESYCRLRKILCLLVIQHWKEDMDYCWITGHSLGGALASLLAFEISCKYGIPSIVYTFGSPRVGNRAFASKFNVAVPRCYRICMDGDVVTGLPPKWRGYKHHGLAVIIDKLGNLIVEPGSFESSMLTSSRRSFSSHKMATYRHAVNAALKMDRKLMGFAYGDPEDVDENVFFSGKSQVVGISNAVLYTLPVMTLHSQVTPSTPHRSGRKHKSHTDEGLADASENSKKQLLQSSESVSDFSTIEEGESHWGGQLGIGIGRMSGGKREPTAGADEDTKLNADEEDDEGDCVNEQNRSEDDESPPKWVFML
eukprot:Nk52_evm58s1020 gene=Nk52_evmTU58s1020